MKRDPIPLHVVKPGEAENGSECTPAKSKLWRDPKWRYTRSEATDLARTFARVRRELAAKQPAKKGRK